MAVQCMCNGNIESWEMCIASSICVALVCRAWPVFVCKIMCVLLELQGWPERERGGGGEGVCDTVNEGDRGEPLTIHY